MCPTSTIVYIGQMFPPLERLERREEPKAQGGEFVEADDCKAHEVWRPDEEERTPSVRPAVVQLPLYNFVDKGSDAYQTIYRDTNEKSVNIGWFVPPLERLERREEPKAQGGEFVEVDDCK